MPRFKIFILIFLIIGYSSSTDGATISSKLAAALQAGNWQHHFNIILTMRQKTSSVLDSIKNQSYSSREDRLNAIAAQLKNFTQSSQQEVLAFLSAMKNLSVKSFWATNKISVKGANSDLIRSLAEMGSIESLELDSIQLAQSPQTSVADLVGSKDEIQWGVEKVGAPELWRQGYTGAGVVVGSIDSGVSATHYSLRQNYRGEYGWFDARAESNHTPNDPNWHGTFVMGIAVGTHGLGVAPGAQWMACQTSYSVYEPNILSEFLTCGEWMLCPTRANGTDADCSKAPHVISNSWGVPPNIGHHAGFFDEILEAWYAGGIIAVFANGNEYGCDSSIYPANTEAKLIAVGGALNKDEEVPDFVSGGPGVHGIIKPDISAPGDGIYSASAADDNGLGKGSGTSASTPHVAGVIALLMTNGTDLNHEMVTKYLYGSASQTVVGLGWDCGDIPETVYPNNIAGWGGVNAPGALAMYLANDRS